jgi:ferritin-like metal-binding protein YciE
MFGTTLRESLVHGVRELYSAEQQQVRELPKLATAVSSTSLGKALALHAKETSQQVARLERVFALLDERIRWTRCPGITGILEECAEAADEDVRGPLRDAAIVATAQRADYYEMAAYGTAAGWAEALGLDDVARLLYQSLDEEIAAADALLAAAMEEINLAAANAGNRSPARLPAPPVHRM